MAAGEQFDAHEGVLVGGEREGVEGGAEAVEGERQAERVRGPRHPVEVEGQVAQAFAVVAEGFKEAAHGDACRNWALRRHSRYSSAATESYVTPLPTPRVACPCCSVTVRIATLNTALPSGAAMPMAPQ